MSQVNNKRSSYIMVRLPLLTSTLLFLSICCRTGSFFTVHLNNTRVSAGGNATLNCQYFRDGCQNVDWTGPGSSSRDKYSISNPTAEHSQLTVTNVSSSDEGVYHCICRENTELYASDALMVVYPIHFNDVDVNQTFSVDTRATIICRAFPGDPPVEMIWQRGENRLFNGTGGYNIESNALIIDPIKEHHAASYLCGFSTPRGLKSINITVNVQPPSPLTIVLPSEVEVNHTDPLDLTCLTNPPDGVYNYTWYTPRGEILSTSSIHYSAGNVSPGFYTCKVQNQDGEGTSGSVNVRVHNRPDLINRNIEAEAQRGNSFLIHEQLRDPLTSSSVVLQWKKEDRLVDFDSRTNVTVEGTSFRLILSDARLEDNGKYELNISNPFGYDMVNVSLIFERQVMTTKYEFLIRDGICEWLKEHKEAIGREVKASVTAMCSSCIDNRFRVITEINCSPQKIVLEVYLGAQEPLPEVQSLSLTVEGIAVMLEPCEGACSVTPSLPPTPSPVDNITPVVVGSIITVVVVIGVLMLTLLIWNCSKRFCGNHKVIQEDNQIERGENLEAVVIHQNLTQPNQPECIGYISVSHGNQPVQPVSSPGETPITHPSSSPSPPHLPPPPLATTFMTPGPAKRPNRLVFLRSNSYHGSTRTRTPPS